MREEPWDCAARRALQGQMNRLAEVLREDARCGLLSPEQRAELVRLGEEGRACAHKMATREFEVAVVGLENSGKSALGNALIGLDVLPSASVRCTYTTTELRAGENGARVEFYSRDEFERRFADMLSELGFRERLSGGFQTLTPKAFDEYWRVVSARDPKLCKQHDTTTAEDVRAILRAAPLILPYLGAPPRLFGGEESLRSPDFRAFITGFTGAEGTLERDERPYAVKKVTIYSAALSFMKDAVVYDVPGFNSPTLLHKEQTRRMMCRADAILLVADLLSSPNIDGTQLSMLRETDEDSVPLKDKLFVFANKADMMASPKMLRDNYGTFLSDVTARHRLTDERRVVLGAAGAYMAARAGDDQAQQRLKALGVTDGVGELRALLSDYAGSERAAVLENRARRVMRAVNALLGRVAEEYEAGALQAIERSEYMLVIEAKDSLHAFRKRARELVGRMYRDISARKPFTQAVRARIAERIQPLEPGDALYQEVIGSLSVQGDCVNRFDTVNGNLRMSLQGYLNALVERMVWDVAEEEESVLMEELTGELLSALSFDAADSPHARALEQGARALIERMFDSPGGQSGAAPFRAHGFIALVTRFVPGITSFVMGYPLGSRGRCEEGRRMQREVRRLFLETGDESEGLKCVARVLTHEDAIPALTAQNEKSLARFVKRRAARRLLDEEEGGRFAARWAARMADQGVQAARLLRPYMAIPRAVRGLARPRPALLRRAAASEEGESALDTLFDERLSALRGQDAPQAYLWDMAARAHAATDEAGILAEINEDIRLYQKLLSERLVPHLNLEKAFYERFINQINAMTGMSSVYDRAIEGLMNQWLAAHVKQLRHKEFAALERRREAYALKKRTCDLIGDMILEASGA